MPSIEVTVTEEAAGENVVDWLVAQEDRATVKFDNLSRSGKGARKSSPLQPLGSNDTANKGDSRRSR